MKLILFCLFCLPRFHIQMKSYSICPSLPDLFHSYGTFWAQSSCYRWQDLILFNGLVIFHCAYVCKCVFVCVCLCIHTNHIFFIHSSLYGYLLTFISWAIVSNAAMNRELSIYLHISAISFSSGKNQKWNY